MATSETTLAGDRGGPVTTRREVLRLAGAAAAAGCAVPSILVRPASATPAEMQAAISKVIGEAKLNVGKVKLDIPPLVENGNTVPCAVTVDSPMTARDHVKAIHVFNEKNPQPNVFSATLGPRAGLASISTRIRLSDTQTVVAIAEMSDGSFWSGRVEVVITLGACLEDLI
jgi:sulfur-oxidizing protein SoxY